MIQPVAQKRKEPNEGLYRGGNRGGSMGNGERFADADEAMDTDMKEISSKLKKVVCVDESSNRYHQLSRPSTEESVSSLMAIRVDTRFGGHAGSTRSSNGQRRLSLISDHLRKYSNSLMRMIDNNLPNLKVKFVSKFSGCYFPIGVSSIQFNPKSILY